MRWFIARWSNVPFFFLGPTIRLHRTQYEPGRGFREREAEGMKLRRDENNHAVHAARTQPEGASSRREHCDPIMRVSACRHSHMYSSRCSSLSTFLSQSSQQLLSVLLTPTISAARALHFFFQWHNPCLSRCHTRSGHAVYHGAISFWRCRPTSPLSLSNLCSSSLPA